MQIELKDYEQYRVNQKAHDFFIIGIILFFFGPGIYVLPILGIIYLFKNKFYRKYVFSHMITMLICLLPLIIMLIPQVVSAPGATNGMHTNYFSLVVVIWQPLLIFLRGFYNAQKGRVEPFESVKEEIFILYGKKGVKEYKEKVKSAAQQGYEEFCETINKYHQEYESRKGAVYNQEEFERVAREIVVAVSIFENKKNAKKIQKTLKNLYAVRNHDEIGKIHAEYQPKLNARMEALIASGAKIEFIPEYQGNSEFDGKLIQLIGINIACFFIGFITLGLAVPKAICMKQKWVCKHTVYQGKRLEFDGNGMQLFGNWIKWLLLSFITIGIYALFIPLKIEDWKAKHTHLAGETKELGGCFDGKLIPMIFTNVVCSLITLFTLGICLPASLCKKQKWIYKHRVYDGRRLEFTGKGMGLLGNWIKWMLLSVITLGVYALFVPIKLEKWKATHTRIKDGVEVAV